MLFLLIRHSFEIFASSREMKRPKHHPGARTGAPPPPPPPRPTSCAVVKTVVWGDLNLHAPPHKIALRRKEGRSENSPKNPVSRYFAKWTDVRPPGGRADNLSGRGFNPSLLSLLSPSLAAPPLSLPPLFNPLSGSPIQLIFLSLAAMGFYFYDKQHQCLTTFCQVVEEPNLHLNA